MKNKYDFSKGVKHKFYIPEKDIELPVYLDKSNQEYFSRVAREKKTVMSKIVNQLLKKDRELIDSIK